MPLLLSLIIFTRKDSVFGCSDAEFSYWFVRDYCYSWLPAETRASTPNWFVLFLFIFRFHFIFDPICFIFFMQYTIWVSFNSPVLAIVISSCVWNWCYTLISFLHLFEIRWEKIVPILYFLILILDFHRYINCSVQFVAFMCQWHVLIFDGFVVAGHLIFYFSFNRFSVMLLWCSS